jgi:predicted glutamine amidotransferase
MCIIVAKSKKAPLPTKQILKNCFENNSDGAGFMYTYNGNVIIDKGYMSFKQFYKRFQRLKELFNDFENKSLVMHFRIGTSAGNTPENTHPYPVSTKVDELHSLYTITKLGIVHNGIIRDYTITGDKEMNDTQHYIQDYVAKIYSKFPKFYEDKDLMLSMEKMCDSKLCFLTSDDELYYVGDFKTDRGIKYSNETYSYSYNDTKWYSRYSNDYYRYGYDYALDYCKKETKTDNSLQILQKGWTIYYSDDTIDVVDEDNVYAIDDINNLYFIYENYDGTFSESLIDVHVRVYDERGDKIC